jgi:rhodanese-related sulfurtransferase
VTTVEDLVAGARARLARLSPREAVLAADGGAVLVDIRPEAQRRAEGEVPGALVIERNHLEWRFDPPATRGRPRRSTTTCRSW